MDSAGDYGDPITGDFATELHHHYIHSIRQRSIVVFPDVPPFALENECLECLNANTRDKYETGFMFCMTNM